MDIGKFMVLGLLLSLFACASITSSRSIEELAPAFEHIKITQPDQNINPMLKSFSGWWVGRWDGILPSQLIIEEIESNSATVVYTWGDHPSGSFKRGRSRSKVKVSPSGKIEFDNYNCN